MYAAFIPGYSLRGASRAMFCSLISPAVAVRRFASKGRLRARAWIVGMPAAHASLPPKLLLVPFETLPDACACTLGVWRRPSVAQVVFDLNSSLPLIADHGDDQSAQNWSVKYDMHVEGRYNALPDVQRLPHHCAQWLL